MGRGGASQRPALGTVVNPQADDVIVRGDGVVLQIRTVAAGDFFSSDLSDVELGAGWGPMVEITDLTGTVMPGVRVLGRFFIEPILTTAEPVRCHGLGELTVEERRRLCEIIEAQLAARPAR